MFEDKELKDARDRIAVLVSENEDLGERLANETQLRLAAEARVATMVRHRDPAQLKAIADAVALQIDDAFARGAEGGHFAEGWIGPAQMRRNAVAELVRQALANALTGVEG
jgi:hypothetical protein